MKLLQVLQVAITLSSVRRSLHSAILFLALLLTSFGLAAMIRDFEEWTAPMAEVARMSTLSGATIGIEASDYLDRLDKFHVPVVHPLVVKEPLTPALGGTPFGLKPIFRATIAAWRAQGITPLFVFSGLNVGKSDTALAEALRNSQTHSDAWALYDKNDPNNAVDTFRKSTAVAPESLFRLLQTILREEGVEFIVAPYGASAQVCPGAAVDPLTVLALIPLPIQNHRRRGRLLGGPSLRRA
jgi:hypothetical protein